MLKELISHSLHCSQYIKYDCYKAPLDLHSATWFTSAAQEELINFIGYAKRGSCPCSSIIIIIIIFNSIFVFVIQFIYF